MKLMTISIASLLWGITGFELAHAQTPEQADPSIPLLESIGSESLSARLFRDRDGNQKSFRLSTLVCGLAEQPPKESIRPFGNQFVDESDRFQRDIQMTLEDRWMTKQAERISLECKIQDRFDTHGTQGKDGFEFRNLFIGTRYLNRSGGPLRNLLENDKTPETELETHEQGERVWLDCHVDLGFESRPTSFFACTLAHGPGMTTLSFEDVNWGALGGISFHTPQLPGQITSDGRAVGIQAPPLLQLKAEFIERVYFDMENVDRGWTAELNANIRVRDRGYFRATVGAQQWFEENIRHTYGQWDDDIQMFAGLELVLTIGPSAAKSTGLLDRSR